MVEEHPTPHMIFIDEAVQYLNHPLFGDYVLKMIREQRKKNGVVVLAGQEPTVLTGSENGRAAMQNIDSFVIWPNRSAKAEDYMEEGLGLNEREFEWVKHPRGKLEVMLKRKGAQSVILNTDLSCLGEHLHLLATGTEKVRFAEDLMRQHDDDWLSKYLQHYKAT
jgi:type IV secretory pathway VirB4 component